MDMRRGHFYGVIAILISGFCNVVFCQELQRPCPDNCITCVSDYFSSHSQCSQPSGNPPESETLPGRLFVPYTHINSTLVIKNLVVNEFEGTIHDFYLNPETDNAVLTVRFENLTFASSKLTILFHRLGLEPIKVTDAANATFPLVFVTATIPCIDNLQMEEAFITAYASDSGLYFNLGPNIMNDEIAKPYIDILLANIPQDILHLAEGIMPFALDTFIKYRVCDFNTQICNNKCWYRGQSLHGDVE